MEVSDIDGSGTIDNGEFTEIITKLDENFAADQISDIFAKYDTEGSGELPVEAFGVALCDCLKLMQPDEANEEE